MATKSRITARQIGGNDGYSWAVLIDGRVMVNGLTRREVSYYKQEAQRILDKREGRA